MKGLDTRMRSTALLSYRCRIQDAGCRIGLRGGQSSNLQLHIRISNLNKVLLLAPSKTSWEWGCRKHF